MENNQSKTDLGTLIGLVFGIAVIFIGIVTGKGQLFWFFNVNSLLIVVGGTFAATLVNLPLKAVTNTFSILKNVHYPLLKKNLIFAFILISIEVIKELPITLILRPFNFETFATQAYIYASQDLLEAAALPSLFLIFWAGIMIFFTSKYILLEK